MQGLLKIHNNRVTRYAIIGVLNTLLNYTVFISSTRLFNINTFISAILGFSFGATTSYFLNARYTFIFRQISQTNFILFLTTQLFILLFFSCLIFILEKFIPNLSIVWFFSVFISFCRLLIASIHF